MDIDGRLEVDLKLGSADHGPVMNEIPSTSSSGGSRQSIDEAEIARFAALADDWWNPDGSMGPLHRINPTRIAFIRDQACAHFGRDVEAERPLDGVSLVDVGCGAGLLSEPMARLGAAVVGIDAAAENIAAARRHGGGLNIDYRHGTAEDLAASHERFDMVLAMEIVEHVANRAAFLASVSALVAPGGLIFLATLNRTAKSFALAIVGAEYLLGWLPRGTHRWDKFSRPAEIARELRREGLQIRQITGVGYDLFRDTWSLTSDPSVNYMMVGFRP
jgi:2-polyprenyl-6-hydroxyphenyl methylase/3-demethylubiquinone-9 3-methyltransferase